MRSYPSCGRPLDRRNLPAVCPKCDKNPVRAKARKPLMACKRHAKPLKKTRTK